MARQRPHSAAGASTDLVIALVYTRVSSDDQAREGVSLDAQLAECRRYVAQREWMLGTEYSDVMSGKRDDRPQYQALLNDLRRLRADGRPVVVVVAALDRFGRRLLERVRCREELKALGVATHSVRDGGEVSDLVANILASVAQEEVRRLGERVSATRRHIVRSGWAYPARTAFGYRLRDATPTERAQHAPLRVLEPDPLTVDVIREAFARAAAGETVRKVARWMASLPATARGNRAWCYASVRAALSSPTYVARPAEGVADVLARPLGNWPALVEDTIWQQVQERIAMHAVVPRQSTGRYLLTGLLRCPECGGRMIGATAGGQRPSRRYRCSGWLAGSSHERPGCRREIPCHLLDGPTLASVADVIGVAIGGADVQAALKRAWQRLAQPGIPDQARRIATLEQQVQTARRRLADGAALLVDGTLDRSGYEALREQQQAVLEAAQAEITRLQSVTALPALPPLEGVLRDVGGWSAALDSADIPAQRDVLAVLIENVKPERVSWGKYQLRIAWTPLAQALVQVVELAAA